MTELRDKVVPSAWNPTGQRGSGGGGHSGRDEQASTCERARDTAGSARVGDSGLRVPCGGMSAQMTGQRDASAGPPQWCGEWQCLVNTLPVQPLETTSITRDQLATTTAPGRRIRRGVDEMLQ
jgi:hypothetical protein